MMTPREAYTRRLESHYTVVLDMHATQPQLSVTDSNIGPVKS